MNKKFSIRLTNHQGNTMLNMCDEDLLDHNVNDGDHVINISKSYYGERIIGIEEAKDLLQQATIINLVGEQTTTIAIEIGIGSKKGIKIINGIPFLVIYKI